METLETKEIAPINRDLPIMRRDPVEVLQEASRAARALKSVVDKKEKKVMIRGEVYPEIEDWQVIGNFYGLVASVDWTKRVEIDGAKGFESRASVLRMADGVRVSSAESLCLDSEARWKGKDAFAIKSMAQTRACSKAFRTILSWVIVMAGYKPTPAEEMDGVLTLKKTPSQPKEPVPVVDSDDPVDLAGDDGQPLITVKQIKRLVAIYKGSGHTDEWMKALLKSKFGWSSLKSITRETYDGICMMAETKAEREPGEEG